MLRLSRLLASCLLLALATGCSSVATRATDPAAERAERPEPTLDLPRHTPLGRVVAVDRALGLVMVEFYPGLTTDEVLDGRPLMVRRDDLSPTAELVGTRHQRGVIHGARLVAGLPQVGEEVVLWRPPPTRD